MKHTRSRHFTRLAIIALLSATEPAFATSQAEGPDFPNSGSGTAFTLTVGANVFSGTLNTPGDGQDRFTVTVPVGFRISQATKTFAPGGSPAVQGANISFNNEDLSGTGAGTFVNGYPLGAGTYSALVSAGLCVGNGWSVTLTVVPPDFTVTTSGNSVTITDTSDSSSALGVSFPSSGQVAFAAAGKTFSVNGGPALTENSGNVAYGGGTLTVDAGAGSDLVLIGAGTVGSLVVNGGTGDDTVFFNNALTAITTIDVDLQNDAASPGTDAVSIAANTTIQALNAIVVKCSRNVSLATGSALRAAGAVTVEANQQATATPGNFSGVTVAGGTIETTNGILTVKGRGGNDAGGSQIGVNVEGGGLIRGMGAGASISTLVEGTGGASTGILNRGVTVNGANSKITGTAVSVTGTAGANGGFYGIGVAVLNAGEISGTVFGADVNGTGAGQAGSGFNMGIEIGGPGSTISGGILTIDGRPGPGVPSGGNGSWGIYMGNFSALTSPSGGFGGSGIVLSANSISVDATSSISTPAAGSFVQLASLGFPVFLGTDDTTTALGLTDAELDRVSTPKIVIGNSLPPVPPFISDAAAADITLASPITRSGATDLVLHAIAKTIVAPGFGEDVNLAGGTLFVKGQLSIPITGQFEDSSYPRLNALAAVNLSDATLLLSGTFPGSLGQRYMLAENDGIDVVAGTFTGLPEGAILPWPGSTSLRARISYQGGTGNDVTLTLIGSAVVNTTADSGPGSLRDAIAFAATHAGADLVSFELPVAGQPIVLDSEIVLNDTTGSVTLDASSFSTSVLIDGGAGANRIFSITNGSTLNLNALTLTGGNGIGAASSGNGGAIYNAGTTVLLRCTLFGNTAGTTPNGPETGGAIYNAEGAAGLTLSQCTLAGNQCISNRGGAIASRSTLNITHCTISGNTALIDGGGIRQDVGPFTIQNSIVSQNTASNASDIYIGVVTLTRAGANLVASSGADGGATTSGPAFNPANPLLAPLGDYGGPTPTMALLLGSPARNQAIASLISSDQRGFSLGGGSADIGAYDAGTTTNYNAWIYENLPASTALNAAQHASSFDFDGDGITNGNEWIARTNPGNPAIYLRITQFAKLSGDQVEITFPTSSGRIYQVESSTNLSIWTTVPDSQIIGTNAPATIQFGPFPNITELFFRIRVGP